MLFAEYGARVRIDGIVDIPDGTVGTIVSDVPLFGHAPEWTIQLDGSRQQITMYGTEFDVTQAPSESAYRLTQRYSVEEVLTNFIEVINAAGVGADGGIYASALVFELYRLNFHAEAEVYYGMYEADGPAVHLGLIAVADTARSEVTFYHVDNYPPVDPDKYSHDEDWGADDGGWESGTCEDGEYITSEGNYAPLNGGDDGTGYPVYRVED